MRILPKSKFTWILIIFIIYVYYKDYSENQTAKKNLNVAAQNKEIIQPAANNNPQSENTTKDQTLKDKLITKIKQNDTAKTVLDALVRKAAEDKYGKKELREIVAGETGVLAIVDVIKGSGTELNCGAKAEINYDAFMSSGIAFDSTKAKAGVGTTPIVVQTGKNQVIKGLEAGIIGMKEGGRRKISIPPGLGFNVPGFENSVISKGEVVSYDVELVSVKEGPYKSNATLEVKNETTGSGKNILCGDRVQIKYNLKELDDAALPGVEGEEEFALGAGNVPMGFEMAVAGMRVGGKKVVVIPYGLLRNIDKSTLKSEIKLKKTGSVRADIEVTGVIEN